MKRKIALRPYLYLFAVLLLFLSLPLSFIESLREGIVEWTAPLWKRISLIKQEFSHTGEASILEEGGKHTFAKEEIARLSIENQLLRNQLELLQELLNQELLIQELSSLESQNGILDSASSQVGITQTGKIAAHSKTLSANKEKETKHPLPFRSTERERILALAIHSLPARIIYRSPASWNSAFWIDAGENDNVRLGRTIVAKNSPVVVGCTVVGLVDEVGSKKSRIRLITDPSLTPAVRAVRVVEGKSRYLGKGELRGSLRPEGRSMQWILRGTGFNYDFADEEGPARDLTTGKPYGKGNNDFPSMLLIEPNDWLITSGMDGVFPSGLFAAKVSLVHPLKEGDYYYEIEAVPCCGNLDHLSLVSVLPPL